MYMMAELCDEKDKEDPVGSSVFDHDSTIGLGLDENEDHWIRDAAAGTWTRVIKVPRKRMFHPGEGQGGPSLETLSRTRTTVPLFVEAVRDDWRAASVEDALLGDTVDREMRIQRLLGLRARRRWGCPRR